MGRWGPVALVAALAMATAAPAVVSGEVAQKNGIRMKISGEIEPKRLPRVGTAPVSVTIGGRVTKASRRPVPQLQRIVLALNSGGRLNLRGLPVCRVNHIQPSTNRQAMEACGGSLVGHGRFAAHVALPEASPFPSEGKMLAFNGRLRGQPAILAHIYGTVPAPISFVLPFVIRKTHGTFGTVLEASLPEISEEWGSITSMKMTLGRRFSYRGRAASFLSAGCPAPQGASVAPFSLARTSFEFTGGTRVETTLERSCRVRD